jgi:predicted dehydrogenase
MCDFMSAAPVSVTATGRSYLNPGIDDVVFATFLFDLGVAAHVHASWPNPNKVRQITVVGSKKMAVCDDLDCVSLSPLSEITGSFLQHKTLVVDSGVVIPEIQTREPLLGEVDGFLTASSPVGSRAPTVSADGGW